VVRIDHHQAEILRFDAGQVQARSLKSHKHPTGQHGSGVRTEHEFFGQVCGALAGTAQVLVAGAHTARADFRHYVEKHRPALVPHVVGYETVDRPTQGQLLAMARQFFDEFDRKNGTPAKN
jgi:stalled ribosome rescue protein Dom34